MSLLAVLAAVALQAASPVDPASAEGRAILEPVDAVFAALAARDGTRLAPLFEPGARITAAVERASGERVVSHVALEEFAAGLTPGPEQFEEVMPDPIIAIDGDVGMVWGFYTFTIDGALSHCGSDHFDMIRRDGVWKINGLTWNQRRTGCD